MNTTVTELVPFLCDAICVRCARNQATHLIRVASGSRDAVCDSCDSQPIDEDLVRQSLIDAIALCAKVKIANWFGMSQCAQYIHIHIDRRLNEELKALLVGDISYYK